MLVSTTLQVTPPYFVCYSISRVSNFWMHYGGRYLGGCHRASFHLANKKAGLLNLYITHVTVVVDPIRAKSCRSLCSLLFQHSRSVIALPVDQRDSPRVTVLALTLTWPSLSTVLRTRRCGNLVPQPSALY